MGQAQVITICRIIRVKLGGLLIIGPGISDTIQIIIDASKRIQNPSILGTSFQNLPRNFDNLERFLVPFAVQHLKEPYTLFVRVIVFQFLD